MNETNLVLSDLTQKIGRLEVENSILRAQLSIANTQLQTVPRKEVKPEEVNNESSPTDN